MSWPLIEAYQSVGPLSIGELWAVPRMLRASLIEGIQHLAGRALTELREGEIADFWANRLIAASRRDPNRLFSILAELPAAGLLLLLASRLISSRAIGVDAGRGSAAWVYRAWVELDGRRVEDGAIQLGRDPVKHRVRVRMHLPRVDLVRTLEHGSIRFDETPTLRGWGPVDGGRGANWYR